MVKRLIQKVIASFRKKPASPAKTAKPAAPAHVPAPKPEYRPPDRAAAGEQKEWKPHRGSEAPQGDRPRREHPPHGDKPHRAHAPHGQHAEGDQRRDPRRERSHGPRHERAPRREETAPPRPKRDMTPWDPASYVVPVAEGKTRFGDLDLAPDLLHAIADLNFQYCTPIQAQSMPHTLGGRDIFGKAQTGTGKTAAFLITAMTRLLRNPPQQPIGHGTPRVLVLAPTRELCLQIHKDATALGKYTDLNIVAVFGGMDYDRQRHQLTDHQVDIVVATPGRLLDFKKKQDIHLSKVEILVIDEADRMLDMGFIPDVREIVFSTPPKGRRQTMFFSATLTPEVQRLAAAWTHEPAVIEIEPEQVAVDTVEQSVYIVTTQEKFALLYNILIQPTTQRVIVFANRRDEAERLKDALRRYNIECALLSGAVPQDKRVRTLEGFREGKFRVLVATDVAGRGIHVDGVSHVVNYNLPEDPEDYVHRIGRTGRAGASGQSVSFACEEDSFNIPKVEEYLGRPLKITHPDDAWLKLPPPPAGGIAPEGMPIRRAYSGPPGGGPRRRGPPRRSGGPRGGPR